jgi:hypothetical protein
VAAVDASGNESTAADPIGGAAFSTTPPDPPTWNRAQWVRINGSGTVQPWSAGGSGTPAIDLGWSLADRTEAVLLQRADSPTAMWQTVASWADRTSYHDESATTGSEYRYRLKVRDSAGNVATGPTKTVSPPGGN